jgi:type II secretory pathway pseudopilin PulG
MEFLATVGMIGILGGITLSIFVGMSESAKETKLQANVESLNQAITVYRSNGGTLASGISAQQVLTQLKTTGDDVTKKTLPGYRGSYVDARLIAVDIAAGDFGKRAVLDSTSFRFETADAGAGIRFELQDDATADYGVEESRVTDTPGFAKTSSWVCDFTEVTPSSAVLGTPIAVNDMDPVSTPGYHSPLQLAPPIFSIPGGNHPSADFPLTLTLSNDPINPVGSVVKYSIDGLPWQTYEGTPIMVAVDQSVVAYVDGNGNSDYFSSFTVTNHREEASLLAFSGNSAGNFYKAEGADDMVVGYSNSGDDAGFEWGKGTDGYTTGSSLNFNSDSFSDVYPENWFRLSGLEFFNSTIDLDTQATSVWVDITLNLTTPSIIETFGFGLNLENTLNAEGK